MLRWIWAAGSALLLLVLAIGDSIVLGLWMFPAVLAFGVAILWIHEHRELGRISAVGAYPLILGVIAICGMWIWVVVATVT